MESEEHRFQRLEADRIAHAVARAEESQEERNARLEAARTANAHRKSEEYQEERHARLEAERTRQVSVRSTSLELQGAAFVYNPASAAVISERFVIGRM